MTGDNLPVAKAGVLLGSAVSAMLGLVYGLFYVWNIRRADR